MTKKPKPKPKTFDGKPVPILGAEMWPLRKILPYDKNPRTHPQDQIDLLAGMIARFGWDQAIVVDEAGVILKGHGRLLAAFKNGYEQAPVVQHFGLSEQQKTEMRISDNSLALLSGWDVDLLKGEIISLKSEGFDIGLLGFPEIQLRSMGISFGPETGNDPEAAPEPPKNPVSRLGDVWVLGKHRLLCGDSTEVHCVKKIIGGLRPGLMNTDPPYGINYGDIANSRSRPASVRNGGDGKDYSTHDAKRITNDDLQGELLQSFLEKVIRAAVPFLSEKPAFYLWHPMLTQGTFFAAAAAAADILIHRQIIWVKPSLIMGRGDYHWRHELAFYGWVRGKRCAWLGDRAQDTVWNIGRENDGIHPTQKPTELFIRPMYNHLKAGEWAYEPFSGSGSQIIAGEITGRRVAAIELEAAYVDVAVLRWQTYTGKEAVLEATGASFAKTAKDRQRRPPASQKKTPAARAGASAKAAGEAAPGA